MEVAVRIYCTGSGDVMRGAVHLCASLGMLAVTETPTQDNKDISRDIRSDVDVMTCFIA